MLTVENIYDAYARFKQDVTDVDLTVFTEWTQFVARFIYDKNKKVAPSRFVKKQAYSVILDPNAQALPTDFMDLNQTVCGLYFYDTRRRLVATFDSLGDEGVTFSDSGGTSAYNEHIKIQGSASRGFTGDAEAILRLSFATNIDWEDFDDSEADSPNNDYISIYVYVGNTAPTSATIEFSTSNAGTDVGVNQLSYTHSSLVAGWNRIKVLKSVFTLTGSASWGSLGYLRLIYTGGDATTNVYWDKLELIESETNGQNETSDKLGITGYGRKQEGYFLEGSNIVFTGVAGGDYMMKYMPQPPVLDELTDYFTVDGTAATAGLVEDRHLEFLVKAIDVLYSQWDEDREGESIADQRFVRALGEVLETTAQAPQISQMEDFTSNF